MRENREAQEKGAKVKLTIAQKRQIVVRFKAGWSIRGIAYSVLSGAGRLIPHATACACVGCERIPLVEFAIRDFLNGKFKLKPGRRK